MNNKIRIGLLFGGKSGEHEVSLQSAKSINEALDKNKYQVVLIGIDKMGKWLLGGTSNYLLNATSPKTIALDPSGLKEITIGNENMNKIDVIFPVMHGTYGEDGSMQGLLEVLEVAYVGSGVLGSAVGMDKDVMKRLLNQVGIPTARFFALRKHEIGENTLNDVLDDLGLPVFVKPANLGSSVGVTKVHNKKEFLAAIDNAFLYDVKILVEENIRGREIECSVLGNDTPIASVPGEVISTHEFYSYEAKYIDENGAKFKIPADLPKKTIKIIQNLAIKTFKTLEGSGMARVDFFLKKSGEVLVNEINTIPGFTNISMYPKLFAASGISYSDLLDKLIQLAIEKKKQKDCLIRTVEVTKF